MMKALIFTSALLAGCASDPQVLACKADMRATFDEMRTVATRLAPASGKAYVANASLTFRAGMTDKRFDGLHELDGRAVFYTADVYLDPESLCKGPIAVRERVIAHELGHLLSYVTLPDIKAHSRFATPASIEDWGNEYGAKILRSAGRDASEYLRITDEKCNKGSAYFCDQAKAWRDGLNQP